MSLWAAALTAALTALPAAANDSVAGLALGGLQLLRTHQIAMVSEDLHITPDQVRVRYVFRNLTKQDITTLVAFPLPAVGFGFEFDWVPMPFPDQPNYVGFTTRIDGTDTPLQVESRALLMGLDRTEVLTRLGAPLNPFADDILDRIAALPAATRAALRAENLIDADGAPLWQLSTVLWRPQTFPVGRDLVVEHSYAPVRGGMAHAPVGNASPDSLESDDWYLSELESTRARWCIEPEMEGELAFRRTNGVVPDARAYGASVVDYVLTTGAHWAGPIGHFRLAVEVPNEWDSVFVCFDGARRTAPNRIEVERTDFWPERDLSVLFLHLWGEGIERTE
jgi:hypothetical protein